MNSSPEVRFRVQFHRNNLWLMVALDVEGTTPLALVLDTGTVHSALSAPTAQRLLSDGVLTPTGQSLVSHPIYRLGAPRIENQPVPDIEFVVSNRPTLLRIDGMLGLNFLALFREVRFEVDQRLVTLIRRP